MYVFYIVTNKLHKLNYKVWDEITYPKFQQLQNHWNLGIEK